VILSLSLSLSFSSSFLFFNVMVNVIDHWSSRGGTSSD